MVTYFIFFLLIALLLIFGYARWHYKRRIVLFRSGDLIRERHLFGKSRVGTLSKFDNNRISYIPDNGYDLVHRPWYWFYVISNISFNQRTN